MVTSVNCWNVENTINSGLRFRKEWKMQQAVISNDETLFRFRDFSVNSSKAVNSQKETLMYDQNIA